MTFTITNSCVAALAGLLMWQASNVHAQAAPRQDATHDHAEPGRIAAIAAAMHLRPGSILADIGAGAGDYTVKLARIVAPGGRVFAVDISAAVLARLKVRAQVDALNNVEVVEGTPDSPRLAPASIDSALIVNAYHEMTDYRAMLGGILASLKPGGRLVIIEPVGSASREQTRDEQTRRHQIAPELVLRDLREAGFDVVALEDPFRASPSHQNHLEWMLIATPSRDRASADLAGYASGSKR